MRHRGDVVSKTEILESVWDLNYDGDDNVVEVYVGYLRRKIDQPFGRTRDRDGPRRRLPAGGRRWLSAGARPAGSAASGVRTAAGGHRWSSPLVLAAAAVAFVLAAAPPARGVADRRRAAAGRRRRRRRSPRGRRPPTSPPAAGTSPWSRSSTVGHGSSRPARRSTGSRRSSTLPPGPGDGHRASAATLPIGEGDPFVVVARGADEPGRPVVVLAAQSLESVQESTAVVASLLLFGYPLVLLAVALTSYWLTGRALAPGRGDPRAGRRDRRHADSAARVPVPPAQRRDRPPRRHHERDAGPAAERRRGPAPLRRATPPTSSAAR